MGCVYLAQNKNNGKVYVGKTVSPLEVRKRAHIRYSKTKEKFYYFQKAIEKHGADAFEWKVLFESGDNQELLLWESYFIEQFNSSLPEHGYNLTLGGEGVVPNDATRKRLMMAAKEVGTRPEVRKARSEARKKAVSTPEGKARHTEAVRSACKNPSWQEKHKLVLESLHGNKLIQEKLAKLNRDRAKNQEWIAKNKFNLEKAHEAVVKPVVCLSNGIIYHGSMDAHRKLGMAADKVTANCRGRIKSTMGFHFRYATSDECKKYREIRKTLNKESEITVSMLDSFDMVR